VNGVKLLKGLNGIYRNQRGGRTRLRPERKKNFDFPDQG